RGVGDIGKVAVGVGKDGRPVRVADVARVTIGPDLRLGIAERDGKGEAVGGVVVMRYGENALRVIDGVKQRIAEIAPALPAGARIDAGIVMLGNLHKHIEHEPDPKGLPDGRRAHWERVFAAAREVGPALFMSLLIITLSFLPVFTLEDQEGRLFRPLALTKTF